MGCSWLQTTTSSGISCWLCTRPCSQTRRRLACSSLSNILLPAAAMIAVITRYLQVEQARLQHSGECFSHRVIKDTHDIHDTGTQRPDGGTWYVAALLLFGITCAVELSCSYAAPLLELPSKSEGVLYDTHCKISCRRFLGWCCFLGASVRSLMLNMTRSTGC